MMVIAFVTLASAIGFVFAGNLVVKFIPPLNRFALPGAVAGGIFALAMGPQVIPAQTWPISASTVETFYASLSEFPAIFINVVFACLMLGRSIGAFGEIWNRAKPQIIMGHVFAWGQYASGSVLHAPI